MKPLVKPLISAAFICAMLLPLHRSQAVELGAAESAVIAELGKPDARLKRNDRFVLFYGTGAVEVKNGRVVKVDPTLKSEAKISAKRKAEDASRRAAGLKMIDGKWMTPEQVADREKSMASNAKRLNNMTAKDVKMRRAISDLPTMSAMLAGDRVTVIDFYADWCGPCKTMSSQLASLKKLYPDIVIRKVDIETWDSPVAKKHNIRSIPAVYVFNKKGQKVTGPTSRISSVVAAVKKSK